jgi:O-antigen ligase
MAVAQITQNPKQLEHPIAIGNLYLTALVEFGIIGISLSVAMMVLLGRQILSLLSCPGDRHWVVLAITVSIAAVFINGMTAGTLFLWPIMVVFWLQLGIIRAFFEVDARNMSVNNQEAS